MATMSEKPGNVLEPKLSRRQFIKAGGVLVVGFSFVGPELLKADTAKSERRGPVIAALIRSPRWGLALHHHHGDHALQCALGGRPSVP